MSTEEEVPAPTIEPVVGTIKKNLGLRKNGKQWKDSKAPQRLRANGVPKVGWQKREQERQKLAAMKELERQMTEERQEAIRERVRRIKERAEQKAEKERYEKLSEKMHRKRVERLKRREKRNKLLKER
ncbi:hypothetical protein V1525DRAFT_452977 [Lipomyces kononenkoae]|uniref:Uncharacterized protein n=1 Tax=Lipomyces kononenkoae TaxID=34357 RepID=A0ACC3SQT3_LIPKO